MKRLWFLFFLILTVIQPISAHGYIVRAVPEDRAVLDRAPVRVQYWFSESLEPDPLFSSLKVRNQNGEVIATGGVDAENPALMTVRLPSTLPDGAYIVEIRSAFASDGHVVTESRVFFVGEEVGTVAGQAATNQAIPLEVFWRALLLSSITLLFGIFSLYAVVLVPAWGNSDYAAGLLPPRVMERLFWIAGLAFAAAFVANLIALLQQSTAFFGTGLVQVIEQNLWQVVRIGSRFGDVWNARLLFLIIAAALFTASLYYRKSQPELVRPFWMAVAWLMPLVMGTFSATSHAAGSLMLPWVGILFDWLHTIAVGLWIGGLMALVLVLPAALQPYTTEQRRWALVAVLKRFSPLAYASAGIVITTGIFNSLTWISTPDEAQSSFGGALALKILLVLLLLLVGAAHHIALHPEKFQRFSSVGAKVGNFIGTLRLETVLAVGVLTAAGLLTATPVPIPDLAYADAPSETQTIGDYNISLTLSPGGPGINTYDTVITRDGELVDGLDVRLQAVAPSREVRSTWQSLEAVDSGLYVSAGAEIDRTGEWWTLVDFRDETGEFQRAAFNWSISQEAAVIQSRNPGILNLGALVAVFGAIITALMPFLRRVYARLDLSPVNVAVAVGAIVLTIAVLMGTLWFAQESQRRYEAAVNPPPSLVNPVLPDAASLQRGETLYTRACQEWGNLDALISRLPRTRDEELFAFTRDGWSGLPACEPQLTDMERWDIVNFIRTLEI